MELYALKFSSDEDFLSVTDSTICAYVSGNGRIILLLPSMQGRHIVQPEQMMKLRVESLELARTIVNMENPWQRLERYAINDGS